MEILPDEVIINGVAIFPMDESEWLSEICNLNTIYHEGYYYTPNAILTIGLQIPSYVILRNDNYTIGCYSNELHSIVDSNSLVIYRRE